jgi:hypothetical protein
MAYNRHWELLQLFERINDLETGGETYEIKIASCIDAIAAGVVVFVCAGSDVACERFCRTGMY